MSPCLNQNELGRKLWVSSPKASVRTEIITLILWITERNGLRSLTTKGITSMPNIHAASWGFFRRSTDRKDGWKTAKRFWI